ncbi:FtsB family cell division protein [Yinghuangia soli]|uniref:FtsB family cell division protein n=1 Tax=Yinghuangia soli TaxID=2908204 RepID=UPI0027E2FB74|nr:septum formation initiator family protein [Yinghuangia soli]
MSEAGGRNGSGTTPGRGGSGTKSAPGRAPGSGTPRPGGPKSNGPKSSGTKSNGANGSGSKRAGLRGKARRIVVTWGGSKGRPNRLTGRAGVLALVVCVLGIALVVPVRQYLSQRQERADLREQTQKHREEVERLRAELERWKDPAYVRQQARRQLHYVNPGDIAYSVIPPAAPATAEAGKPGAGTPSSWPDKLWTSVREADADPAKSTAPPPPRPAPAQTITDPRSSAR